MRLCKRYRTLLARGKHANQVVVAIARELIGFMWAIAKEVPVAPEASLLDDHGLSTEEVSFLDIGSHSNVVGCTLKEFATSICGEADCGRFLRVGAKYRRPSTTWEKAGAVAESAVTSSATTVVIVTAEGADGA